MILLCDLTEDTPVHISTCTSYDFNALMPSMWNLWCWCVCLHLVTKMSDQILDQQINIKLCVKFGKNVTLG